MSNVLRLLAFDDAAATGHERDRVAEILFEVDDQTPEDLATGLARLRQHPAVRDVLQLPAFGKKNRMAAHIRVLADPAQLEQVCDACFEETTTIGLRYQLLDRIKLQRSETVAEVDGRQVGVKRVRRSSGVTAKAEADDIGGAGGGREAREALRQRTREALDKGVSG